MSKFLNLQRPDQGNKNDNRNELSKWRRCQHERVSSRAPELISKMRVLTQRMRIHFQNDPEGLKAWNEYEKNVLYAYERNLRYSLSTPLMVPNSVLYDHLMKRKAHSKGGIGRISIAAGAAVGLAIGVGVGVGFGFGFGRRQEKTKE